MTDQLMSSLERDYETLKPHLNPENKKDKEVIGIYYGLKEAAKYKKEELLVKAEHPYDPKKRFNFMN